MKKILFFLLLIFFIKGEQLRCFEDDRPAKIKDCFSRKPMEGNKCCYAYFDTNGNNGGRYCYDFGIGKSNAECIEQIKDDYKDFKPSNIKVVCEGDPYEEDHASYLKIGLLFIIGLLF